MYENCAGFLYIPISENETDPLDSTRIHPKQYHLTNQIAASALEVEITNLEDQHWLVPKVMRNP